ncbi:ABC1 family-domain-containing protein [Chytriomyces cf. hyalinus JEL632]|nr:ABC1 family-domain-containing protein [Chytriomyces cf. hyalinus JEL632]
MSRYLRIGGGVGLSLAAAWSVDHFVFCDATTRTLRTAKAGALVALDYKLNFVPGSFDAVHKHAADVILDTCKKNNGLYIKFAQQIATFSAILPPQWHEFRTLYDQAPSVSYAKVVEVIKQELGSHPDELFDSFEETPIASASIAQVHRARVKGTGELVAVKVQKPEVKVQVEMDLFAFRVVVSVLERLFDLPMSWTVKTIEHHLRQELDFVRECRNAEKAAECIQQVPSLAASVHVPKVYWNLTTSRVMTAEWIDGVNFGHVETVEKTWSQDKIAGMMTVLVDLFSDQIFRTGFVHCDPHPGNILLRPHPLNPSNPQIVLLDHGLYIQSSEQFTQDYTRLWTSLFSHDISTVEEIVKRWGINDTQMFAMGTLQKPWSTRSGVSSTMTDVFDSTYGRPLSSDPEIRKKEMYEMQMKMKERAKKYLADTDRVPRELIFVGRNLNIIRSNNKVYGSPVNRINLMCDWAVKSQNARDAPLQPPSLATKFKNLITHPSTTLLPALYMSATLFVVSIAFHATRWWNTIRAWWRWVLRKDELSGKKKRVGFEEVMEESLRRGVYEQTGVLLDENAFEA